MVGLDRRFEPHKALQGVGQGLGGSLRGLSAKLNESSMGKVKGPTNWDSLKKSSSRARNGTMRYKEGAKSEIDIEGCNEEINYKAQTCKQDNS